MALCARQIVPVSGLIREVWGDQPPAHAANLVSIYVLRLRRLIGDTDGLFLATRAPGYQLRVEPSDIDAQHFKKLIEEARSALVDAQPELAASLLNAALELWRGDALADVPISAVISAEAECLEDLRRTAEELRFQAVASLRGYPARPSPGRMNDDALVSFASVHELRDWLASREIPVHLWGTGQAKRVEDLWSELSTGESVLTDLPPRRQVAFVSVIVRRGGTSLTEVAQLLATGQTRTRRVLPSEKMLPGEDAETAAYRCVGEELGVPRESCRIIPGTCSEASRTAESPSYPGLVTRYRMNQVEMAIPDLPGTAFSTPESDGSEDATVKIHYWDWCPDASANNLGGD
jgi:hypothetical protein